MSEVAAKNELPENWVEVPLEDCVDILDSQRVPLNSKQRSDRIEGKAKSELYPYYGATGSVGFIDDFIFEGEHLLLGEDAAPFFDKSKAVAYTANGKFWVNNHAHILNARASITSNKYLLHYLNSFNYKGYVNGTTRLKLNQRNLKIIPVPLAPPEQQKRIVAKIEELFSHIDAGIAALNKAKQLLKQYRQSVLKAAVTGELTKEWRQRNIDKLEPASQLLERILQERRQKWEEQQLQQFKAKGKVPKDDKWKGKYKESSIPDANSLPKLPKEWLWVTMGVLCEKITDGTHHSPKNKPEGEYKYITAKNIKPWRIDLTKITYVDKKVHDEIYARCDVKKGDVLYIKDGATTGIAALNNLDEEFSLLSSVGVLRFPTECDGDYFVSALNSPLIKDMLLSKVAGVAITRLTLKKLNEGFVTLPPLDEQHEIVRVVNEKLDSIKRLEAEIESQLKKSEKNKQAILASAFSGGLVNHLDSDGNSKDLLISIEAARVKVIAEKPAKKKPQKKRGKFMKKLILDVLKEKGEVSVSVLMQAAGYEQGEVESFYDDLASVSDEFVEIRPKGAKSKSWPYDDEVKLKLK